MDVAGWEASADKAVLPRLKIVPQQRGFPAHVGPYYEVALAHGMRRAMLLDQRHLNADGVVDGGVLASFADFMLGRTVGDELGEDVAFVTIELNCQFHAAAHSGRWLYGEAQVMRRTRSLVFAAGELFDQNRRVAFASGIWKLIED